MNEFALEIENLYVRFGDYTALEGLSFDVATGTFNAIVGPNGSGKTTLLKVILGIIKLSSGKMTILGNSNGSHLKGLIGYVPQIKTLDRSFPALAYELVESGKQGLWPGKIRFSSKKSILETLAQVGAEHLAFKPISQLSGGELQRIYLARCLIKKPKILLLDEPATGIDMVCESNINSLIQDYRKKYGITVIMVTHNWATANHHAEYVLLLNRRQVGYGKTADIFNRDNLSMAFTHIDNLNDLSVGIGNNG